MFIFKIYKGDVVPIQGSIMGINIPKEIEIQLKIIRIIEQHELINQLSMQFKHDYYFLYEVLSDMWLIVQRASELKKQILNKYCDQVILIGVNDDSSFQAENSFFFQIKYKNQLFILKAVSKQNLQVRDAQEVQNILLEKQIQDIGIEHNLNKQLLQIIDHHSLHKDLINYPEYSFTIFEYYICNIEDLLIYQNGIQKLFHKQQRIHLEMIKRILTEVQNTIKDINNKGLKIKDLSLKNIFLTYHKTQEERCCFEIKLGNLQINDQDLELQKQMNIILLSLNNTLSQDEQNQLNNQFGQPCEDQFIFQQSSIEIVDYNQANIRAVGEEEEKKQNEGIENQNYYDSQQNIRRIEVYQKGIIQNINASQFSEIAISQQSINDSSSTLNRASEYELVSNSGRNSIDDSKKATKFSTTISKDQQNDKYSMILQQLYKNNKNQMKNRSQDAALLSKAYMQTNEYQQIQQIIEQKYYIHLEFVKQGQNSKHFTCQKGEKIYYAKVYKINIKSYQNALETTAEEFLQNQQNTYNLITFQVQSISMNQNLNTEAYSQNQINQRDQTIDFVGFPNQFLLKPVEHFTEGNFRILIFQNCLCNLRELLPYMQPSCLILSNEYTIYDLFKQVSYCIITILKCIHDSGYIHMDYDLTKFLIDDQGNIRISNFQMCLKPQEIKVQVLNCSNSIYQKKLNTILSMNENFAQQRIREGVYNFQIIKSNLFMLGFNLIELFFSLDYQKLTQIIQNYTALSISNLIYTEIIKLQLQPPKIAFKYEFNFLTSSVEEQSQYPIKFQGNQDQEKELLKIALKFMNIDISQDTNRLLSDVLSSLQI